MGRDTDDEALAWDGDDDPTLDAPKRAEPLPTGFAAVGKGSDEFERAAEANVAVVADAPATEPASMSNVALLSLGVFGGVYLLYVIGWIIGGLRLEFYAITAVSPALYYASLAFAIAAPVIWFGTTYLLTRDAKTWLRIVWLLAGAVLLVPWPFLMVGAVGQ